MMIAVTKAVTSSNKLQESNVSNRVFDVSLGQEKQYLNHCKLNG